MKNLFKHYTLLAAMVLSLSACATADFNNHQRKYANVTLDKLLAKKDIPTESKNIIGSALVERAQRDFGNQDYNSALRHTKLALDLSPDNYEIKYLMAESFLHLSKPQDAEVIYSQLLTSLPSAKVHQGYGLSLLAQNQHQKAQPWLNKAVMEDSELWRAWNGLGIIYDLSGDWKASEAAYKAGMASAGQNATINNNLGISYLKQDRLAEAVIVFENARTLNNHRSQSDLYYRTALALNGDMAGAIKGATDNDIADLYNQLGLNALRHGAKSKAIQYLKLAIAKSPSYHKEAEKNLSLATFVRP